MAIVYNSNTVMDGLVLYLDAANTKSYPGSGTTWSDLSGNGNNATLVNTPTYSTSDYGYFSFDGTSDHATIPTTSLKSGNQLTFCIWNYGLLSPQQSSVIWFNNASNIRLLNIHLPWSTGTIFFDAGDGSGGSYDRISKTSLEGGQYIYLGWHYWCFTKNSSTGSMKIYKDGELWHSGTGLTRPIGTASGTAYIANNIDSQEHKGYIANCSLYNQELTASQISQNYNATKTRFGL